MPFEKRDPALSQVLDNPASFQSVIDAYNHGTLDDVLTADADVARSLIPPATGAYRDFSYIAQDIPEFDNGNCVACMECVTECPDTAILAKVTKENDLTDILGKITDEKVKTRMASHFTKHAKFYDMQKRKGNEGGEFSIFIDPTKCKGCAECVTVCGSRNALKMVTKTDGMVTDIQADFDFYRALPKTPAEYMTKAPADIMLNDDSLIYVGGAGSCAGCGEGTAIRMMTAAAGHLYGKENMGILAATGCNTVYTSTYPFNPYQVTWANSLFENAPTFAMGTRLNWDQRGWQDKKLWVLGGDGAMNDIGFQALSRMMSSGMDINVLILDTQVYSNTGGQASTASFTAQNSKMSFHGKAQHGKAEFRKEIANICIMHPEVYVAQTICSNINHFYKSVIGAMEFKGPSIVNVYTTCQPEHGVGDDIAGVQAKLAADTRTFPLMIHDPRTGDTIKERLSLAGNVAVNKDHFKHPKTGETFDFIMWARTEGRFSKHFAADGTPSPELYAVAEGRRKNWRQLQELAGIEPEKAVVAEAAAPVEA